MSNLGDRVKDRITGFEGVAIRPKKATITRSQALGAPYILPSKDNYIRKLYLSL